MVSLWFCYFVCLKDFRDELQELGHRNCCVSLQWSTPSLRFIFVISLPCSHGLRSDGMTFVLELQTARQFFLAIRTGFNFVFLVGTPDALTGKLHLQIFSSGMISNFLKFLSTALQYLWSSPREQLQLERSRLIEDHQLRVERLQRSHSNFWHRWDTEENFKEKLRASRAKISNKDFNLEDLKLLYEEKHREELLELERRFRYQLHIFDLRLPRLRDQQQLVLQDSLIRSRL